MCGIAGRVGPSAGSHDVVRTMAESIRHRGPDEDGYFVAPGVELGMRRLSIIDVDSGHQPISDESGLIQVVFNGEIYNFQQLRAQLEADGHAFRTHSDTEVIAHLYEARGTAAFDLLRGMFAIAIWDGRDGSLVLARDALGKKPLLIARTPDGGLLFGSEARAILATGWERRPSLAALNSVLAVGYVPSGVTAYEGITAIEPGSWLRWHAGTTSTEVYWAPNLADKQDWSEAESIERSLAAIDMAVRDRLVSERPIGAFLSGGFDSTIVTALMARHHSGPVKTFTIEFEDAAYDESTYAAAIARELGTDHHSIPVRPDPAPLLERLAQAFDQPFADSSAIPTMLLNEFARQHVVVALGGDGGDEAFAGYDRYRAAPALQRLNPALALASPLRAPMQRLGVRLGNRRLVRAARELHGRAGLADRYLSIMSLADREARQGLWTPQARAQFTLDQPDTDFLQAWATSRAADETERMVATDLVTYLPGDLLVKADIASMAHSLEVRSPLLDRDVVDLAARIPTAIRIQGGETKHVLKAIARQLVPRELVDRPKMGFAIPRAAWLRGPLHDVTRDLLTDTTAQQRGWFDQRAVAATLQQHQSGLDLDHVIWPLLVIEMWARTWIDRDPGRG